MSYLHALDLKTQQKNFYIASFYELDGGQAISISDNLALKCSVLVSGDLKHYSLM